MAALEGASNDRATKPDKRDNEKSPHLNRSVMKGSLDGQMLIAAKTQRKPSQTNAEQRQ